MSVEKQSFGTTKKGEAISLYTVTNKNGMVMKVTDFGAILVSVLVPDKNRPDIGELSKEITKGLEIVFVKAMEDVVKEAFLPANTAL